MKEVRAFAAAKPGPLAVGGDGRMWVIEGKPAKEPYLSFYTGGVKIVSYTANGEAGPKSRTLRIPAL